MRLLQSCMVTGRVDATANGQTVHAMPIATRTFPYLNTLAHVHLTCFNYVMNASQVVMPHCLACRWSWGTR